MIRSIAVLLIVSFSVFAEEQQEPETTVRTLTPEQMESYRFQVEETPFKVEPLSMGQQAIMSSQRRLGKDLLARKLGILSFGNSRKDLPTLQQLVDRRVIRDDQVETWQAVGILFGDILANEFKLQWVSFEDELGASKALRYKKTDNFIFPVPLFSKRVQYGEKIDMAAIFAKLEGEIEQFIALENKPRLPNGRKSS